MTVSDEIIKVLDYLCEKIGIAIDWTNDNVLVYLEELCGKYINYEIATSAFYLVKGIIFLVIAFFIFKFVRNLWKKDADEDLLIIGTIFGGIAGIFLVVGGITSISGEIIDIITCLTLPEKMLIEYAQTLLESNSN